MRWKYQDAKEWHKWFAWKPVEIGDHEKAWLEPVERRKNEFAPSYMTHWEYRAIGG